MRQTQIFRCLLIFSLNSADFDNLISLTVLASLKYFSFSLRIFSFNSFIKFSLSFASSASSFSLHKPGPSYDPTFMFASKVVEA